MSDDDTDRSRREAVSFVLSDPRGREFLWWLLDRAGLHRTPIGSDGHMTAFACGRQDLGQQVLAEMLAADAGAYLTLIKEGQDRERDRAERRRAADGQRDDDAAGYGDDPVRADGHDGA